MGQLRILAKIFATSCDRPEKIGYTSGYERLPNRLTVRENIDIVGRIYAMDAHKRDLRIEELLTAFGIWHLRDKQTGTLSAGQATRLMLAKAFIANPDIVLLDEPTASLDPDIAQEVRSFYKKATTRTWSFTAYYFSQYGRSN